MSGGAQFLILAIEELETCTRPGIRLGFAFRQTSEGLVEVDRVVNPTYRRAIALSPNGDRTTHCPLNRGVSHWDGAFL